MSNASAPSRPAGDDNNRRLRVKKRFILALLLAVAAVAGGYYYSTRDKAATDNAQVDGHIHLVTPRVAGYVTEVLVADNELVRAGQPLVRLDPVEYEVALAQERAALSALRQGVPLERDQTRLRVSGATASRDSAAQSVLQAAQAERAAAREAESAASVLRQAELDFSRVSSLAATRAVAPAELDSARTGLETAQAAAAAAQARLDAARKARAALDRQVAGRESDIGLAATGEVAAEIKASQVQAQEARVRQAELDLEHCTVAAPVDGLVTRRSVEPGRMAARGQALMAVVPLDPAAVWVTANYKETQLTRVRPGQRVTLTVDAYPGARLTGRVESIQSGTGAVFSLFPPENASGNFVKVVQRVPVKIVLDPDQAALKGPDAPVLRLGMSVVPTIHLD
ncbi:MAG: HlyD family secretion protein [Thermodesulfobacteriota bacterium]